MLNRGWQNACVRNIQDCFPEEVVVIEDLKRGGGYSGRHTNALGLGEAVVCALAL
jgi:hypothetical protein